MGDRFCVNFFFYLHMHSHDIASTGETANVGAALGNKYAPSYSVKFGIFGIL